RARQVLPRTPPTLPILKIAQNWMKQIVKTNA
ncbi:unnamed protein product, partial [Allacma fusca]